MNRVTRHLLVLPVFMAVLLPSSLEGRPQTSQREQKTTPLETLNDQATRARGNSPQEVRSLVDAIFSNFAGFDVPQASPLRTRVFNAELDFRLGKHPPIFEGQLVRAVNEAADRLFAPPWAKTNVDQIHILRTATHPVVPQLVGTETNGKKPFGISDRMSPAEAVFVSFFLMGGKMWDHAYRVPPEEWVARVRAEKTFRAEGGRDAPPAADASLAEATSVPPGVISFIDVVNKSLNSQDGVATREANAFLSNLGIRR